MSNRLRSRGQLVTQSPAVQQTLFSNCGQTAWTNSATLSLGKVGVVETISDVVTPGFRKKSALGAVIMNPMSLNRVSASDSGGSGYHDKVSTPFDCSGTKRYTERKWLSSTVSYYYSQYVQSGTPGVTNPSCASLLSDSEISSASIEAMTRALSERGRGSNSNLYETLAEGRKALALLPSIFQNIRKILSKRSGRIRSSAEAYLAYRYGLRPLIQDAASIIEAVKADKGRIRETSRGYTSLSASGAKGTVHTWSTGSITFNNFISDVVSCRAMSLDEVSVDLHYKAGFGAKQLLTVPWELIPYSFVVDWFVNVGDFIGSLVPVPQCQPLGSCLVITRTRINNFTAVTSTANNGWSLVSPLTGTYTVSDYSKTRSPGLSSGFVIKTDFRFDSVNRVLDSLALLYQILHK